MRACFMGDIFLVYKSYMCCVLDLYTNTQHIYTQQIGSIAPVNRVITPFVEAFISRRPTYLCGMGKHSIRSIPQRDISHIITESIAHGNRLGYLFTPHFYCVGTSYNLCFRRIELLVRSRNLKSSSSEKVGNNPAGALSNVTMAFLSA